VNDARSISLWDLNGLVKSVSLPQRINGRLPMSTDRQLAATYGEENVAQVWSTAELQPVGRPLEGLLPDPGVAGFTPDGKHLLGFGEAGQLFAWEIASGRRVWQLPRTPGLQREGINRAEVHPSGRTVVISRIVGAAGGELSAWTFELPSSPGAGPSTASPGGWLLPTRSMITALCFSKDGQQLFAGDLEGHFGIVDLTTRELRSFNGEHDGRVNWIGLSEDGQRLATASGDGTARLWDVRMKSPEPLVVTNEESIWDAKFSPDSRWFVCTGGRAAEVRDARSASLVHRLPMNQFVTHVDISPDGRRVVGCGNAGESTVWDARTGALVIAIQGAPAHYVEFSGDGRWFLIVSSRATVEVRETETGQPVGPTLTNSTTAVSAHFSPDGHSLVAATEHGDLEFWSLPEGRRVEKPARHKDVIWTTHFSPDGRFLLTASRDRTAALWEAEGGRLVREFRHDQQVYTAAFSPDGQRIVTGDAGRRAHVWDAETGQRLFTLPPHPGGVWYGEFSADGRLLLTGDDTGSARLWEASSGLPLSGWIRNGRSLKRTHLSHDGRLALSAADDGTVRVWPVLLAPMPASAWLPDLAEAVAGRGLRDDGTLEIVPAERWQSLNASLGSLPGHDFYARWSHWFFGERLKEKPEPFVP